MKKVKLLKDIGRRARASGITFGMAGRPGKKHEMWRCGGTHVPIPRHTELGEGLVHAIHKQLEGELGEDWWR